MASIELFNLSDLTAGVEVRPASAEAPRREGRNKTLWRGLGVLALVAAVTTVLAFSAIHSETLTLEGEQEHRLSVLADSRASVLKTRLDGLAQPAGRLVESELFQLFATEVDLAGGDLSLTVAPRRVPSGDQPLEQGLSVPLKAQMPFMQQILSDFVQGAHYVSGYLLGRDGQLFLTSQGAGALSDAQRTLAAEALDKGERRFGLARAMAIGPVIDIYVPVFAVPREGEVDSGSAPGSRPIAVALLVAPVSALLSAAVEPPPLTRDGERLRLVQRGEKADFEILPGANPFLERLPDGRRLAADGSLDFGRRIALDDTAAVYSVGVAIANPSWTVIQEVSLKAAQVELKAFQTTVFTLAGLVLAMVAGAFGAFWWRLASEHNATLAIQFQQLAGRIERQKSLLESINCTIREQLALKDADGSYLYANPAFARAFGRTADKVIGLDDAALYGHGTAERLVQGDRYVMETGCTFTTAIEVYLRNRPRQLHVCKVPYRNSRGEILGIVSVTRDVTELAEAQRKRERALHQTTAALVRAVELRDPYLAGHSRRLAGIAVAVAERLNLRPEERTTIEIAANLSQIGKLAVPREILAKPERLSPEEIAVMRKHIDHAASVIRDIDFELPVLETILQMHERLDGGGYPAGLAGEAIGLAARVLGTCDVFCARVAPRSYRGGIAAAEAVAILEQNAERYDAEVVSALREVLASVQGEKLLADLGGE